MTYDLIIFDCDGTLVDSEYIHNKACADLLAELGMPQFDIAYTLENFSGKGMDTVVEIIERESGRTLPDSYIPDYVDRVLVAMETDLMVLAGARDILEHCQARYKICVGSNGEPENVIKALAVTGLDKFFPDDTVFTKSMVKNGKPAPDLFLHAAETMGAAPARTLVLEDSVTGVTAGRAAGMTVVGVTATYHDRAGQAALLRESGADIVVESLNGLPSLLGI